MDVTMPTSDIEAEAVVHLEVRIATYGRPSQVRHAALVTVARALSLEYGSENVTVRLGPEDAWKRFDPLAYDGEHPGHDVVLRPVGEAQADGSRVDPDGTIVHGRVNGMGL